MKTLLVRTEIITTLKKYGMSYAELQRKVARHEYNAIVLTSVAALRMALVMKIDIKTLLDSKSNFKNRPNKC